MVCEYVLEFLVTDLKPSEPIHIIILTVSYTIKNNVITLWINKLIKEKKISDQTEDILYQEKAM